MSKDIVNYSIENIKAEERSGKDFDFFRFEYFAKDIEHLKHNHRHEFHAFIFVTGGSGSHVVDFIEYPLIANRCFYISYGQIHAWKTLKRVKGFVILFTDDFYNSIYTGNELIKSDRLLSGLNHFIDIPNGQFTGWQVLFEQIEQEFKNKENDWKLVVCLRLKAMVLLLKRFNKSEISDNDRLKHKHHMIIQFKELINKYYLELKTPKDYAEKLNITPNYLSAICKEITGKPAGQLIRERIILEAKRLILHTQLNISEITHQLGFDDKSHFGKYFKKSTGSAPDKFRKDFVN